MTPERYRKICKVLNKRQPDLTVIVDEVHKSRNLAAILRSCDAVGIDSMHAVVPERGYQSYSGTSASAQKWVNVCFYESVETPVKELKSKGFQVVAAHRAEGALHFREFDYTRPTAILMGAENKGVSTAACDLLDASVYLPMAGMLESYNVSVACSAILLEAERQRMEKGFYDSPRLTESEWLARFFRWAHPQVAEFCDKHALAFPALREDGEINEPAAWYKKVTQTE